jgi:hypothetical protein
MMKENDIGICGFFFSSVVIRDSRIREADKHKRDSQQTSSCGDAISIPIMILFRY